MRTTLPSAIVLLAVTACGGDCDRSGCEAYGASSAATIAQGIAGAIATESDLIANGCQECTPGSVNLDGWQTPQLVGSAQDAATVKGGAPDFSIAADGHYAQTLAPGSYLVCVNTGDPAAACVSLMVLTGAVTTVNAKLIYGPATLRVYDAGNASPRETTTFSAPH